MLERRCEHVVRTDAITGTCELGSVRHAQLGFALEVGIVAFERDTALCLGLLRLQAPFAIAQTERLATGFDLLDLTAAARKSAMRSCMSVTPLCVLLTLTE